MKILFLSENFYPETNAAATRVHERAVYWARWGHQVTVLTSAPNFPEGKLFTGYKNHWYRRETIDGITVIRVKTFIAANKGVILRSLDFISFMLSALIAGLFQPRPDVVVATSPQFFTAIAGYMLATLRRLPFVFELGDLWPRSIVAVGAVRVDWIIRLVERVELFLYRRAAAVIALTHAFKDNLVARAIPAGKIWVIRNGVDLERYAPRQRDPLLARAVGVVDRFVVGYIGTHGLAQDLGNVVSAADLLRHERRLVFLLVGAGAERDNLVASVKCRGLDNVALLGMQPKEMMPSVWALCDVALVHLRNALAFAEVIPSKMFEAMAMGLPILLVAPRGEASTILEEDRAGLWVPAGEADALAAAATRLMNLDDERRTFAAQSLFSAQRHTREEQATRFIAVLEDLLPDAARPGRDNQ